MKKFLAVAAVEVLPVVVALGLIGVGLWFVHRPSAPIAVGALIWVDLFTTGRRKAK